MTDKITGPLGIWNFPILNTLIEISSGDSGDSSFSVKEYNVVRDENGSIESVEIIKGINDE